MNDSPSMKWCSEHFQLFQRNEISPDLISDKVIDELVEKWLSRSGVVYEREFVVKFLDEIGEGKPFCCYVGSKMLEMFLIKATVAVATRDAEKDNV